MVSILKPWKWHRDYGEIMKFVVSRLILSHNWGNIWRPCPPENNIVSTHRNYLEMMLFPSCGISPWKWHVHLWKSCGNHKSDVIVICGTDGEDTQIDQGYHMSRKCQGKTKFSPGQEKVREFWKNVRNFGHLTQVREFCHDLIFRLKLPLYDKGSTWVVFM